MTFFKDYVTLYSMNICKYNRQIHEIQLKQLLIQHDLNLSNLNKIPKNGTICTKDDKIVAAGFIRMIENNMGMLDSYITNPEFSSEIRNQALDMITTSLICQAKHLEIQELMAITTHESIFNRSLEHNFKPVDFKFSILNLN